jgi:hypothetical protein
MESDSMTSTMTIDQEGNKIWRNQEDQLHRTDGPAFERTDGYKAWWVDAQRHRTDGPAFETADGTKAWYLNGQELTFDQWAERVANTEQERTLLLLKFG